MFKKVLLYVTGPGAIIYLGIVLFIHLFGDKNLLSWMIPALIVFFVVFLPVYAVENFKQQDKKMKETNSSIQFTDKNKRIEWEGGNIHGKVPRKAKGPEFMKRNK